MVTTDEEVVRHFKDLVVAIAHQTVAQLGLRCDFDDLVGFGYTGLLEARRRYDPTRGVAFGAFAHYRIRGAMLDGVRKMAFLPRRAHARLRAIENLDHEAERLAVVRGATPDNAGPAAAGAVAARAIDAVLGRAAAAYAVAQTVESSHHEVVDNETPETRVAIRQRAERVRNALEQLPARERFIVHGHYMEGRSLEDLATELGVSKSWGSRIHAKALQRLRHLLWRQGTHG